MFLAGCVTLLVACTPVVPQAPDTTQTFVHAGLGLAWRLPGDWVESLEGGARVFSGPRESQAFYSTIVLQSRAGAALSLDEALNGEFEALAQRPNFIWVDRQVVTVSGALALSYCVQFTYNDVRRFRTGVLFHRGDAVVELSYNAPLTWAAAGLDAYLLVQDTLTGAS